VNSKRARENRGPSRGKSCGQGLSAPPDPAEDGWRAVGWRISRCQRQHCGGVQRSLSTSPYPGLAMTAATSESENKLSSQLSAKKFARKR
jgi:hypothetical protein